MNILEAFQQPVFILPKKNEQEEFSIFLKGIYEVFLDTISKVDDGSIKEKIDANYIKLQQFCDNIIKSANTYYLGLPAKAFFEFEQAMKLIDEFVFPPMKGKIAREMHEPYYRARIGTNVQFKRTGMFHMPFEKREYVTTQRFSIPGLPCLYLSNSVYGCWEELGRPNINKMQVSRLKLENYKINILDLSLSPEYLNRHLRILTSEGFLMGEKTPKESLDEHDFLTLNYIMRWPLMAACSIKGEGTERTFKPEYIFPQFLLQWVSHNKEIDGIKYFSVRTNSSSEHDHSLFANYAFPVKETKPKGLCEHLTNSFSITEPVSWEMLSIANPDIVLFNEEKFKKAGLRLGFETMGAFLELIEGKETIYWRTIFGKIEIELAEMQSELIS